MNNTPGPQPGYVSLIIGALGIEHKVWFTKIEIDVVYESGQQGNEYFDSLQANKNEPVVDR